MEHLWRLQDVRNNHININKSYGSGKRERELRDFELRLLDRREDRVEPRNGHLALLRHLTELLVVVLVDHCERFAVVLDRLFHLKSARVRVAGRGKKLVHDGKLYFLLLILH